MKRQTPEEVELKIKENFLSEKKDILTELELTLSTLQADLHSFEIEYYINVGCKYVLLDKLQATLDGLMAAKTPTDNFAQNRANESQEKAQQSFIDSKQYENIIEEKHDKFVVTPELKSLYRELAKLLHPDLTLDLNAKEKRTKLMQEINAAYQAGDLEKLNEIYELEKNNPENVEGESIGSELIRIIRKIAQLETRIFDLEKEIEELKKTDLYKLLIIVQKEKENGENPLDKISKEIEKQIQYLESKIELTRNSE